MRDTNPVEMETHVKKEMMLNAVHKFIFLQKNGEIGADLVDTSILISMLMLPLVANP